MRAKQRKGFTIVELLIVIVVIAVLAAISIVAYNGIQQRARNSQAATVIQAYKKALLQYATINQAYPTALSACLGDDYPETGVYTAVNNRACFRTNSTGGILNTSFNNEIKPFLGGKTPTPNNTVFGDGSTPWGIRGAIFMNSTSVVLDGTPNPWVLVYTIEGLNRCPVGPIMNLAGWPNATSTPPATGYNTVISGGTTGVECWLAMPDPTKL